MQTTLRRAALALTLLLTAGARAAECTPAPPEAVAEAERRAADAARQADQAESVAVRSGNPGAQARAAQARERADAALDEVAKLTCRPRAAPRSPASPVVPGYR